MPPAAPEPTARFLTIPQVAEELATSEAQILALVKRGDMPAIKLGGRGQWRIERAKLEACGVWWVGDLEAYRQDAGGAWRGYVRWSEGVGATRLGWFGEDALRRLATSVAAPFGTSTSRS